MTPAGNGRDGTTAEFLIGERMAGMLSFDNSNKLRLRQTPENTGRSHRAAPTVVRNGRTFGFRRHTSSVFADDDRFAVDERPKEGAPDIGDGIGQRERRMLGFVGPGEDAGLLIGATVEVECYLVECYLRNRKISLLPE